MRLLVKLGGPTAECAPGGIEKQCQPCCHHHTPSRQHHDLADTLSQQHYVLEVSSTASKVSMHELLGCKLMIGWSERMLSCQVGSNQAVEVKNISSKLAREATG